MHVDLLTIGAMGFEKSSDAQKTVSSKCHLDFCLWSWFFFHIGHLDFLFFPSVILTARAKCEMHQNFCCLGSAAQRPQVTPPASQNPQIVKLSTNCPLHFVPLKPRLLPSTVPWMLQAETQNPNLGPSKTSHGFQSEHFKLLAWQLSLLSPVVLSLTRVSPGACFQMWL